MQIVNLIGLVLNLVGTLIVSFSAGKLFTRIHTALTAHQLTLEHLLRPGEVNVPLFHGLDAGRGEEVKLADKKLVGGLIIICVGFVLQAIAAVAELH